MRRLGCSQCGCDAAAVIEHRLGNCGVVWLLRVESWVDDLQQGNVFLREGAMEGEKQEMQRNQTVLCTVSILCLTSQPSSYVE